VQPVVVEEDAVAQVGNANRPDQVEWKLTEFSQVVPDWKQFRFTIILSDSAKLSQGVLFFYGIKKKKIDRKTLRSFIAFSKCVPKPKSMFYYTLMIFFLFSSCKYLKNYVFEHLSKF
jgi:hypothetical protein